MRILIGLLVFVVVGGLVGYFYPESSPIDQFLSGMVSQIVFYQISKED